MANGAPSLASSSPSQVAADLRGIGIAIKGLPFNQEKSALELKVDVQR
jgi:hypothetical protein